MVQTRYPEILHNAFNSYVDYVVGNYVESALNEDEAKPKGFFDSYAYSGAKEVVKAEAKYQFRAYHFNALTLGAAAAAVHLVASAVLAQFSFPAFLIIVSCLYARDFMKENIANTYFGVLRVKEYDARSFEYCRDYFLPTDIGETERRKSY